jgi:succinyl-diaminopimelate desuccinylase
MDFSNSVDAIKNELIKTTQELIRIRSVQGAPVQNGPFGKGVKDCLERTLEICSSMGFRTKNVDGYAGYAEWGSGDDLIGILVHLDVVPEGSGWTQSPYGGNVIDGKIYGRGSMDNKGQTVSVIYALNILKQSNFDFKKRVRIIFGCNEESGMEGIKYYIHKEEKPNYGFTPDGLFPIINSEKGIIRVNFLTSFPEDNDYLLKIIRLKGGTAPNAVPDYCECELEYKPDVKETINSIIEQYIDVENISIQVDDEENKCIIKSTGIAVASSIPEKGKNAIAQLFEIISKISSTNNKQSPQEKFINFIVENIGKQTNGKNMGLKMEDDVSGPLTLNMGMAEIDYKQAKLVLDIRYPVKRTEEEIIDLLKKKLKNTNITLQKANCKAPLFVPANNFLIKILTKVYEEVTGSKAELLSIGGGTYARALDNFVAFGGLFPGREILAHAKDEFMYIEDLIKMTKIYILAIKALVENKKNK